MGMKPDKIQVANRLKEIRTLLNLSISEFGEAIGNVPKSTVNSWLRGLALPPKEKIELIAFLADTNSDWILWGDELAGKLNKSLDLKYVLSENNLYYNGKLLSNNEKQLLIELLEKLT